MERCVWPGGALTLLLGFPALALFCNPGQQADLGSLKQLERLGLRDVCQACQRLGHVEALNSVKAAAQDAARADKFEHLRACDGARGKPDLRAKMAGGLAAVVIKVIDPATGPAGGTFGPAVPAIGCAPCKQIPAESA